MKKRYGLSSILLICLALIYYFVVDQRLPIMTGFAAKNLCSCHYGADRSVENINAFDLNFSPVNMVETKINESNQTVEASLFGLGTQVAKFKSGIGCILLEGNDNHDIIYPTVADSTFVEFEFLKADTLLIDLDYDQILKAMEMAFKEDYKTRTALLIHKDQIIYEKYSEGLSENTVQLGWSMTKSIINALIGILVHQDRLSIDDTGLFADWKNDERSSISIHHLLQMSSGLEWEEEYSKISDVTKMLYRNENIELVTIDQPLSHPPGTHWYYASGTTNLLCSVIKNTLKDQDQYLAFPKEQLFNPLGIKSAFIETDESGNFIGSSFGYATARDWAKIGRLYLHDGVVDGVRLLPEDWVKYSVSPAMGIINNYGAQIWLNKNQEAYPDLPEDLYSFNGFQGQKVVIIPSMDIIFVRLGHSKSFDLNLVLSEALKGFKYD